MKYLILSVFLFSSCYVKDKYCNYKYCEIINEDPQWKKGIVVNGELTKACELCSVLEAFGATPLDEDGDEIASANKEEEGCPFGEENCKYCKSK